MSDPVQPRPARIIDVRGGSHGLAATYDEVRALADTYDSAGDRLRASAVRGARTTGDLDLMESALLSPLTFAHAEAAVLAATVGPQGLLVRSVGWEADAVAVRLAVAALEESDRAARDAVHVLDDRLAALAGQAAGPTLLPVALAAAAGLAVLHEVDPAAAQTVRADLAQAVSDAAAEHPDLVAHGADGLGGLLDGLVTGALGLPAVPVLTPTTGGAAGLVAALYPHGTPLVSPVDITVPGSDQPPTSVTDLVQQLEQVAALSPEPDSPLNGTIEIQTITGPDGQVRHIVYLPGTDDIATLPWNADGDVRDVGDDLQVEADQIDPYQQGILQAMHDAGIQPGQPVLVVGHSLGGMEVAAILAHPHPGLSIQDGLTAGAPTSLAGAFPPGVHVLSLDQVGDVVPELGGPPGPDIVGQTTVTFDAGPPAGVVGHHDYPAYVGGAQAVDASTDPSVVDAVGTLHQHGFLGGTGSASAHAQVFQITRRP